jgi:glycosyltransferase involved in cell wall biosynthesis
MERAAKAALTRYVLGRADAFAAETMFAARQVRRFHWGADLVIRAIHTDPRSAAEFRPPTLEEQGRARGHFGLPSDGVGIGFLGRMEEQKGPLDFLFGTASLGTEDGPGRPWKAIVGSGPLELEVRTRARVLGVHALGAIDYPEEVRRLLHAVDVVVVPSMTTPEWDEQGPRIVVEAMLSGRIVVGSTCGAIPEMVGNTGFIFPEGHPAGLEAATRKAVQLVTSGDANLAAPRARAEHEYSSQAVGLKLRDLWAHA